MCLENRTVTFSPRGLLLDDNIHLGVYVRFDYLRNCAVNYVKLLGHDSVDEVSNSVNRGMATCVYVIEGDFQFMCHPICQS